MKGLLTLCAVVLGFAVLGLGASFHARQAADVCPDDGACASSPDEPVPDLVGMPVEEACRALERRYYLGRIHATANAGDLEPGHVVKQDPEPGSKGGFTVVRLRISEPLPDRLPKGCRRTS